MPDNSADYEDSDELLPTFDEDDHPARVWNLLWLVNPGDEEAALQQFDAWREARAGAEHDSGDEQWLWDLKDAIDWRAGFYVDWKDTETFIDCVNQLAARYAIEIDWGGDPSDEDFLDGTDVPALMATAYDRLREHGYTLWNWNTGGDAYAGWMALRRDDDGMQQLAAVMGVEIRPGSDAF